MAILEKIVADIYPTVNLKTDFQIWLDTDWIGTARSIQPVVTGAQQE